MHNTKQELTDNFASFFQDKILQIRKRFHGIPPFTTEPTEVPKLTRFAPMTEGDVLKVISSLKSKSCELDAIPTTIFKTLMPTIIHLITNIVNISLGEGQFIRLWKTAMVRQLLKKLGLEIINPNFRPVSNLTFLSKVIERCMLLQLSAHCNQYELQPDYQSAYRAHHSCETAILQLSNDILWGMESQSVISLVVIDLSAAFDTVDHDILLDILKCKFGIEGKALKWFDSYLRPHSFKVVIEGTYSEEQDLTISVPQGSCTGANIFNLYSAPLEEVVTPSLKISRFVDDHSIRDSFKASNRKAELDSINTIQNCMINIKNWMDQVRLKMNPSNTEFIYFGHPRQLVKCTENTIQVAGDFILRSDVIRYLGVWMDTNLSFKHHTTKKCQAAMINFIRIRNICHLLDADCTESLCLSLCISHLG